MDTLITIAVSASGLFKYYFFFQNFLQKLKQILFEHFFFKNFSKAKTNNQTKHHEEFLYKHT